MLKSLFAPLGMKVAGGLIALLMATCLVLFLNGKAADRRADKFQGQLATANALIETQNSAVEALKTESDIRTKAAQRALVEAKREAVKAESVARQLERGAPLSGECRTPEGVMKAGL